MMNKGDYRAHDVNIMPVYNIKWYTILPRFYLARIVYWRSCSLGKKSLGLGR
jgi:hypothetical protein